MTYQWQVKNGESWTNLGGKIASTLALDDDDENYADGRTFRCALDSDWGEAVYTEAAEAAHL